MLAIRCCVCPIRVGRLWNGKVVPLLRSTIKGAVWMQGEANSRADGRQCTMTHLRHAGDLPASSSLSIREQRGGGGRDAE